MSKVKVINLSQSNFLTERKINSAISKMERQGYDVISVEADPHYERVIIVFA